MSEKRKRTTYTCNLSNNQSITVDIGNVDNARGSVSKSTLKELPLYKIESRDVVRIISRRNEVPSALAEIRACLKESNGSNGKNMRNGANLSVVGFDTETRPSFKADRPQNKIALIQIAVSEKKVYLFMLNAICNGARLNIPSPLLSLLSDPNVLKVGVGVNGDEESIRAREPRFRCNGSFVDIALIAKKKFPSLEKTGLRGLTASLLRKRLSKGQQMSNWNKRDYTEAQKRYAALDAIVGLVLWRGCLDLARLPPYPASERLKEEDRAPWICYICDGKEFETRIMLTQHTLGKKHTKRASKTQNGKGDEKRRKVIQATTMVVQNSSSSTTTTTHDNDNEETKKWYHKVVMTAGAVVFGESKTEQFEFIVAGVRVQMSFDKHCKPVDEQSESSIFSHGLIPEEFAILIMKKNLGSRFRIEYGHSGSIVPKSPENKFRLQQVGVLVTDVVVCHNSRTTKDVRFAIVRGWQNHPKIVFGLSLCHRFGLLTPGDESMDVCCC